MTTPPTPRRIDVERLRDLASKATPGPWVAGVLTAEKFKSPYSAGEHAMPDKFFVVIPARGFNGNNTTLYWGECGWVDAKRFATAISAKRANAIAKRLVAFKAKTVKAAP